MAKSIKKARKVSTPEEKAARKAARAEKLAARVEVLREKYKTDVTTVTMKSNRRVLSALIGRPIKWAEFCQAKRKACLDFWTKKETNPTTGRTRKPLSREQVDSLTIKLKAKAEKLAADQQMLKEAMQLLGK